MDLEEREILRESARAFLAKRAPLDTLAAHDWGGSSETSDLWEEMASLGWVDLALTPDLGGGDGSLEDLEVLCEEMGRALSPAPFIQAAVAAAAALEFTGTDRARALLSDLAKGRALPILAIPDDSGRWSPTSRAVTWDGSQLSGRKRYVDGANVGSHLIATALDVNDRPVLVLVEAQASGVRVAPLQTIAGAQWSEVSFESAACEFLAAGWEIIDKALTRTAVMHAAWCSGAAARLLEDTVSYVSERRQFGVPIGSFQAVQHRLADCDIAAAESQTLAGEAARLLVTHSGDARRMAATAFVHSTDSFVAIARSCHQVWGGMGYSTESHVHLFSRRAKAAQHSWGGSEYHLEVVAEEARRRPLLRDRYQVSLRQRGVSL